MTAENETEAEAAEQSEPRPAGLVDKPARRAPPAPPGTEWMTAPRSVLGPGGAAPTAGMILPVRMQDLLGRGHGGQPCRDRCEQLRPQHTGAVVL